VNRPHEPLAGAGEHLAAAAGEVGLSRPHESAALHVSGQAAYTDDLPELAGTLHAALGLSPVAHGWLRSVDVAGLRALPGVVAVYTASDIPGTNDCGPIVHDDPVLAPLVPAPAAGTPSPPTPARGSVQYLGQPLFVVVATTRELARRAAARAKDFVRIDPLPAVFDVREAHARGLHLGAPLRLTREQSPGATRRAIDTAPHRLAGRFSLGGQEQFYLEGHISYAQPGEEGAMRVLCSTQHPTEMQHVVAHVLAQPAHRVQVECRRMGGGFGGKESQSAVFAASAALAAARLRRPVKLRVDRDDDFLVTGRRHGFEFDYEVGFDDAGRVLGVQVTMLCQAGWSTDLSPPVLTRAICHFDNAYWLPNVAMEGWLVRTNTQSNTAFRGFGGPQGALAIEVIVDEIARALGRDALAVRQANYYAESPPADRPAEVVQATPYGQPVRDNIIHALTARLVQDSGYAARRAEVARFNAASPVLKRGLALTPVKFGISFNVTHFNQAGALVHVYTDGSVLVNHGGTEMGQGLNTKVAQVVAHELGLPLARVRCTATDTSKVANTSATAASTGSDLNGKAAQDAARRIRERLSAFWVGQLPAPAPHAGDVRFEAGELRAAGHAARFEDVVAQAYLARVQLWSDGFYATPGLHWDRATLTGHPFYYYAYGAAVTEVVVDTLTGESRVLRADLLHDAGRSLNPAIDIGQIEGAYVQGLGWLTSEELVWHPKTGMLLTHAPSTYKIPTANDMPEQLRTTLWDEPNRFDSIHRSKAVGEPPLLLAFSAFLAIRDAVSAVGAHRVQPPLAAPATPEAILRAVGAVRAGPG
jgi:xanthine dehydrogenase large subunit